MLDVVLPLLAGVKPGPEGQRPALYACENDHDSVHKLQEALEGAPYVFRGVGCVGGGAPEHGVHWN